MIAHSADVAAVMTRLLAADSGWLSQLARLVRPAEGWREPLVFVTALHDLGKTSHGFQTKVWPSDQRGAWRERGHVRALLESLKIYPPLTAFFRNEVVGALPEGSSGTVSLLGAALAHHGRPRRLDAADPGLRPLWEACGGRDPLAEMRRITRHALVWSSAAERPWPTLPPRALHLFAGLVTLADWVGSTRTAFSCCPWADDEPDRYWEQEALPRAARAVAEIGLVPRTKVVSLQGLPLLERLFPATFPMADATPLQRHVADMALPEPGSRLLVESETGSGKTEAALTIYARMRAAGLVGGLFFALPTRATASAMHQRVVKALDGMYVGAERPTVALAVGGEQPRGEGAEPLAATAERMAAEDRADEPTGSLAGWAAEHHKARLAAEIVVGTIDQALLAALPVKHAHLRLAAVSRHLVVVDELHSYDRYMTVLLTWLLDLLSQSGGMALFMSATLSDAARCEFGGGEPADEQAAIARAYPCFAVCSQSGQGWTDTPLRSTTPPKQVAWTATTLEAALDEAIAAARAGARVLLLRNTITAARAAADQVAELGAASLLWSPDGRQAAPYHSRYTKPDRLALDEAIRRDFGRGAANRAGGCILISTQVAEQSLDVDFDLLVTDLCPVDVLLQRVGRLHRHAERNDFRPEPYRLARAVVIAPAEGFTAHLAAKSVDAGWGVDQPYADYAHGELTWRLLTARPEVTIPADNRALVEAVYHPTARERLRVEPGWDDYWRSSTLHANHKEFVAKAVRLPFDQSYEACVTQFDNELGIAYRTRLGLDTVQLELPEAVRCWYGQPEAEVRTAELPAWALPQERGQPMTRVEPRPARDGCTSFAVGGRVFWYAADGWRWEQTS